MDKNEKQYDKEYLIASIKNWLGGIIIIGSTLIPGTALLKIFGVLAKSSPAVARLIPVITKIIVKNIKFSKPLLKQIITNALKKSVIEGGAYGGIYGIGHSIHQDKNFKETVETITDSIINAIVFNVLLSSAALSLRNSKIIKNTLNFLKNNIKYKKGKLNNGQRRITQKRNSNINGIRTKNERITNIRRLYTTNDGNVQPYQKRSHNGGNKWLVIHIPNQVLTTEYKKFGWATDTYYELIQNSNVTANYFLKVFRRNREIIGESASQVYEYSIEQYKQMKLFISARETSGFAIKSNGDIVSLFSSAKGSSHAMLELAIQNGGMKLDCFDTFLTKIYEQHGFKITSRVKWNEQYKPKDWNKEFFKMYNNGEPDVVYMELDKSTETNRTPDIVSNYSEMTPSQTVDIKRIISIFKKSAAKRLAIWKPMSKPYVDSRFRFTTELHRLIDILNKLIMSVNRLPANISKNNYKKLLLFLLLLQLINKRKKEKRESLKNINFGFNNINTKTQNHYFLNPNISYERMYDLGNNYVKKYSNFSQNNSNNYSYPDLKITPETSVQISDSLKNYKNNNENSISGNVSEILNSLKNTTPINLSKFDLKDYYPTPTKRVELDMKEIPVSSPQEYNFNIVNNSNQNTSMDVGDLVSTIMGIYDIYKTKREEKSRKTLDIGNVSNAPVEQYYEFIPE